MAIEPLVGCMSTLSSHWLWPIETSKIAYNDAMVLQKLMENGTKTQVHFCVPPKKETNPYNEANENGHYEKLHGLRFFFFWHKNYF